MGFATHNTLMVFKFKVKLFTFVFPSSNCLSSTELFCVYICADDIFLESLGAAGLMWHVYNELQAMEDSTKNAQDMRHFQHTCEQLQ